MLVGVRAIHAILAPVVAQHPVGCFCTACQKTRQLRDHRTNCSGADTSLLSIVARCATLDPMKFMQPIWKWAMFVFVASALSCGSEIGSDVAVVGGLGQDCYANSTCNQGLVCNASEICEQEEGAVGGLAEPCYPNQTCDDSLLCNASNICEQETTCSNRFVLFVNRFGGLYTRGPDDPATNTSALLTDASRTIAAFPYSDTSWQSSVAALRTTLAPFDILVTEQEPETGNYIEIVVTGDTSSDVAGVSPLVSLISSECTPK